ncbi:MAG: 4'-phosphopantetheinyl transferase superfamily protein [Planctomycetes bacterium]|nr:4'-phosphopantetheinyl transferase superfamily protein [Planctomycetota bacterium]
MVAGTADTRPPGWPAWNGQAPDGDAIDILWVELEAWAHERPEHTRLLAPAEHARWAAIREPLARTRFGAARAWLRTMLARASTTEPTAVRFERGPHGKPAWLDPRGVPVLQFNLSRSGPYAVLALASRAALGVDVEVLRELPDCDELEPLVLAPNERARVAALDVVERSREFLRCWTRKEAVSKGLGTGLALDPRAFEIGAEARFAWASAEASGGLAQPDLARELTEWSVRDVEPPAPCALALAARGHAPHVRCWSAA